MKPYPLASLNHFTFPLITIRLLQSHTHWAPIWDACPAVVPSAIEMTGDLRPVKALAAVRTTRDTTRDCAIRCGRSRAFPDMGSTRSIGRDRSHLRGRASVA